MGLCLTFVLTFELFHRALLSLAAPGDVKPPMMPGAKTVAPVRQRRLVKILKPDTTSLAFASAQPGQIFTARRFSSLSLVFGENKTARRSVDLL